MTPPSALRLNKIQVDRFFGRVQLAEQTACWPWTGALNDGGYGVITFRIAPKKSRQFRAHRIAYELWVGPIDEGLQIDHLCSNRPCVNPWHLEPVTAKENTRRGRVAKITPDDVRAIRAELSEPFRRIMLDYSLSERQVSGIAAGLAWEDVV